MDMAKPVLNLYTEATDGSSVEIKESALVWQYKDADRSVESNNIVRKWIIYNFVGN